MVPLTPSHHQKKRKKPNENPVYEFKMTNEEDQKGRVIKSGALPSKAENSKTGTVPKIIGETLQTALSIVVTSLKSAFQLLKRRQ